jgi:hypothetical protein
MVLALLLSCGSADVAAPPAPPEPVDLPLDAPGGLVEAIGRPVALEGRDLVIASAGGEIRVSYLSGTLTPVGGVVDLEAPESFTVDVDALEVRIPEQTLEGALAVDGKKAPVRDVKVRTEGEILQITGKTRPLGLPFTFRADPRVTERGSLALELERVRVLGLGVRGFLGAFRGRIEDAANKQGHLIDVDDDRLTINPFAFLGPPAIVARLGELTPREDASEGPGLTLTGGALRTGSMVLFGTTLRLVAEDGGPLVLDPAQFDAQLEGGVVKLSRDRTTVYVAAPGGG